MESINWIQEWYQAQCDGDWEHEYGIKVQTLDNPGWDVKIDLFDTDLEEITISWTLYEESENDWWGFSINNAVYEASGDPTKLIKLFDNFKGLVERFSSY